MEELGQVQSALGDTAAAVAFYSCDLRLDASVHLQATAKQQQGDRRNGSISCCRGASDYGSMPGDDIFWDPHLGTSASANVIHKKHSSRRRVLYL